LQEVLDEYQGTILLVSHDRYLIDALGTQIWEIEPGQVALQVYEGTYSQYRASQEALKAEADARLKETVSVQRPRPAMVSPEERRRRTRLKEVEAQIATLEEQLAVLSRKLENPPADPAKVQRLGQEYVKVQSELDLLIEEWEQLGRLAEGGKVKL
jgi:ATP-binding cassette subfamily F protein 3